MEPTSVISRFKYVGTNNISRYSLDAYNEVYLCIYKGAYLRVNDLENC